MMSLEDAAEVLNRTWPAKGKNELYFSEMLNTYTVYEHCFGDKRRYICSKEELEIYVEQLKSSSPEKRKLSNNIKRSSVWGILSYALT